MKTKIIFVLGGVCSSLGKGIATSSLAMLFKAAGLKVFAQKLDPYLNVDPGTMNPEQHGEVFVTNDGTEADLDLGHYERFIDENLNKLSSLTTGKIYMDVINKEREGKFLGRTIQIVPHITDTIKEYILKAARKSKCDIMIVEVGGTIGDIEGLPYIEAIRQLKHEMGNNSLVALLTLLPYLKAPRELKTKPTQTAVQTLRGLGIVPDIIFARSDYHISKDILKKISKFCDVPLDFVFPAETVDNSIYEVPINFNKKKVISIIAHKLNLPVISPNLENWKALITKIENAHERIKIGLVIKYTGLEDAYISIIESLNIAGYHLNKKTKIVWIDAEKLGKNDEKTLESLYEVDGILVPGGFGSRGVEGKMKAITYARKHNVPCFGICLGMQLMCIEFARDYLKDNEITSQEFNENNLINSKKHIIHYMPGQHDKLHKGGTMRLGQYSCTISENSQVKEIYNKQNTIFERHRHRYEFNNHYKKDLEKHGIKFSGINKEGNLIEIIEYSKNDFWIGCQFHPEFLSRPIKPHPLFSSFIMNAIKHESKRKK